MKKRNFIFLKVLFLAVLILPVVAQKENNSIEGNWLGTLEVSGIKLRLVLKVAKNDDGFTAKLNKLDQDAKDLLVDSIKLEGNRVTFSAAQFGISYQGTINEKGDEISGTFPQGNGAVPFIFKRIAEIPALIRPQDPIKPYPYEEEEIFYKNEIDQVKLAGTLTLPRAGRKSPAVILITGSGSQDRDEAILGHRPFLVLADYLTKRGIAVLRVDDRGIGKSELGSLSATTENFVGDVLAGVNYLKSRPEINPREIGLIGHSEGGMIAPMAAVRSKDVAFIVMLAGMGQTGEEAILSQLELIQKKSGVSPEAIDEELNLQKNLLTLIKSESDNKIAEAKIIEMLSRRKSRMNEQQSKDFAKTEANIKASLNGILSPWYRYFLSFNPRPILEKVKIPVLAFNGENDAQVISKANLPLISEALKKGKNKDFTIKSFPKLNHLFQTSQTGLPNEYGRIEETMAPVVLEAISNWILERTIRR